MLTMKRAKLRWCIERARLVKASGNFNAPITKEWRYVGVVGASDYEAAMNAAMAATGCFRAAVRVTGINCGGK